MDNKVKKETIEIMVKQAQANLQKTMAEILTERTKGQVNAAIINDITSQINTRAEQMAQQWRRIKIEGGTAGNGTNIPKRTFLKWTTKRIDTFEMMVGEYIAGKQEKSAS